MNPDIAWLYGYSDVEGVVAAPADPLVLTPPPIAGSWSGVWELLELTCARTLGAAAVNYQLALRDRVTVSPIFNVYAGPLTPAAAALWATTSAYAINPSMQAYVNPSLGGDTWRVRSLWRRRLTSG